MASIVSKLSRAAFATRASSSAVRAIAAGGRPAPAAATRVSPAGEPKSEEVEKARPKSKFNYLDVDEKALESDEAMWAYYEDWCKYHGKSHDRGEMKRRFRTFKATARRVHNLNSSNVYGKAAMNEFADMTQKEIYPGREYIRAMREKK